MTVQSGGALVCATLKMLGLDRIYSVSGNQILPIYDAAGDAGLRIVHMRHESAAAYAATAASEIGGRPGVLLTSAGPGFLAALTGVAAARSMELPVLFLSGASPTTQRAIGAFQDLPQQQIAGAVAKTSLTAERPETIVDTLQHAWRLAQSGIPGPVHVSLPADVLLAETGKTVEVSTDVEAQELSDDERGALDQIAITLREAKRPLILARPAAARGVAGVALKSVADALGIEPVVLEAPRGLSDLKYANIVPHFPEADCALVVAPADFASGFLAEDKVATGGSVLLIDAQGDPVPQRTPDIHIQPDFAPALAYLAGKLQGANAADPEWTRIHRSAPVFPEGGEQFDGIHPLAVASAVAGAIEPNDVIVLDGGEFCQWIRLGFAELPNLLVWNGKIGAIGGSPGLAIGAATTLDGQGRVVTILGDGSAGYHLSELETAERYGLNLTVIIGNDARWAAEWHMQAARYGPERTFETELLPADYHTAAAGYGGTGELVTDPESVEAAINRALDSQGITTLNIHIASVRSPADVH